MADKFLNTTGLSHLWSKITTLLSGKQDKISNPSADKILIDDGNGQAQDSSVSIIDVALMSDVNGKQDLLTAGRGIRISNNTISNDFSSLSAVDLNDIRYNYNGFVFNASANYPTGYSISGTLLVTCNTQSSGNTTHVAQIFRPYNSNNVFVRYYNYNTATWSAWERLATETDLSTKQNVLTAGDGIQISGDTITNIFSNYSSDLNDLISSYRYVGDGATNKPTGTGSGSGGGLLTIMRSTYGGQLFIPYSIAQGAPFYRKRNNNGWQSWRQLVDCYESGDAITTLGSSYPTFMALCPNANSVEFTIPLDKPVNASSFSFTKLVVRIWNTSGAVVVDAIDVVADSSFTIATYIIKGVGIKVNITKSGMSAGATGRIVPVNIRPTTSLTFS